MRTIISFIRSLNGVFAPKTPLDNPAFAEIYASIMDMPSNNGHDIKRALRKDFAMFGSDFKKVTKIAKGKIYG